jgi:hypothetical protein
LVDLKAALPIIIGELGVKFKTIFILFNVVILISFLFIYLMPLFMLGWEFTTIFWQKNWVLPVIFIIVLIGLNVYFAYNRKLFQLLEKEDWVGLLEYLEEEIYQKQRITKQKVRVLINATLVLSKPYEIYRLETFLQDKKPQYRRDFALSLGVPYLLENNPQKMELFFKEFLDLSGVEGLWVRWDYGFALLLGGKREESRKELMKVSERAKEPVLLTLTGYLLESFAEESEEAVERVRSIRDRVKKGYTKCRFEKEIEKSKANVQAVILIRLIQDATKWLYGEETEETEIPLEEASGGELTQE